MILNLLRILALLGLAALLSACAGRQLNLPSPEQLDHLPPQVMLDVPFHPQDAYQCGPASLAMMLNQRGIEASPDTLKDRVYLPERQGTLQVEMVAAAREQDLLVYPLNGKLENLLAELAAGNPVLVMQNLAFNWYPQWHYAVVVGYDLNSQELILHSGLNQAQREPFKVFLRTWHRADNWAQLTLPPEQLPASAEPLAYLRAANDLEQVGRLDTATTAYLTAQKHWPDEPVAGFALGNIAWAQNKPREAMEQFSQVVERHPGLSAGWNNLLITLEALGCESEAAKTRECLEQSSPEACPVPRCPANASR